MEKCGGMDIATVNCGVKVRGNPSANYFFKPNPNTNFSSILPPLRSSLHF